jgi:hypothetical protein
MCEFVGDDLDMQTLTPDQKEKLRKDLEKRKEQLIRRVLDLEVAIYKITH